MSEINLFLLAARQKFRFPSNKGELTTEQLFDLQLTSRTSATTLDDVARKVNAELKALGEESFVGEGSPGATLLSQKLEVVKAVIKLRQDEGKEKEERQAKAAERNKLEDLLAKKQDQALENLSEDELKARLAAL